MGREFLLPEHADSWGEFNARVEFEMAGQEHAHRLTPLWWSMGGMLFGLTLVICTYAVTDHHWWLWLCMLATLGAAVMMAARAVDRADRERNRRDELAALQDAWLKHMDRGSTTW